MASTVVAEGSVEFKVFKKNFAYLKDGLKKELDAFVPQLYEKDLVTPENRDKALGTADINKRTIDLLTAIECQVKTNPNAFSSFLGVLKSVPALGHLATKLEGDYDHMVKPPLDSYSAETPTDPCGSQLVAPLEADDETEKTEAGQRDSGAITTPLSSSTMQTCDDMCALPHSTKCDTKLSEPSVFISPTPETSHESKLDIIGTPQSFPLAENAHSPRHSLSVPNGASTQTVCVTQPEFRRELKLQLKGLEDFVTASYSQKEEEVEAKSTELAQTSNEVQRQSKELYQLGLQLVKEECQRENYEAEIRRYQEELERVESQHMAEKDHLENQLLEKTRECKDMTQIACQLAKQKDWLEKQNDRLDKHCDRLDKRCDRLDKRCDEQEQLLKSEREEHNQELQQHKQEIHRLGEEVDGLKVENISLGEKNTSLCKENTSLCEENISLCKEVKQKEADVRQKEAEIHRLRQRLELIDSEFSKRQEEIQQKIEQKKIVFQSHLNTAELLDIETRMKQSVSQLSIFVEDKDPVLKKLISDIQQLFQIYNRKIQRSVSSP